MTTLFKNMINKITAKQILNMRKRCAYALMFTEYRLYDVSVAKYADPKRVYRDLKINKGALLLIWDCLSDTGFTNNDTLIADFTMREAKYMINKIATGKKVMAFVDSLSNEQKKIMLKEIDRPEISNYLNGDIED